MSIARARNSAGFEGKSLPAYPAKRTDCYVLLKNQWPYVQGGDYPVCRAVVENLNKLCDQPRQYESRKIHPSTQALARADWEPISAKDNPDLVKQTVLVNVLPTCRESRWQNYAARVEQGIAPGDLKLFRAEINAGLGDGQQIAYRVENAWEPGQRGYNQASLMIAEAGATSARACVPDRPRATWRAMGVSQ